jgi:NADPH:quinone reductase-like Zn-dependent oxidoreductase
MNEAPRSTQTTARKVRGSEQTMKAIVQRAYGSADVLAYEDVERPVINDNDVLVRVHAAAINHADWVYVSGRPLIARLAFGLRKPKAIVRGKDVAGEVEAVGANVTRFHPGDQVYAEIEAGGFAEYVSVPEKLLALKPANLTFGQAATVPLAARTALQGLRDGGKVQPGQKVLINGASGGVGTFAVQIAKALGAEVTGVSSTRNAEMVRSLGADNVVDYTRENFTRSGKHYDVILDLIGNHSLAECRRALTPQGTLVLSSGTGGRVLGPMGRILRALIQSPFLSQNIRTFSPTVGGESLDQLRDMIESGTVTPAIDRTYPLSDTAEAVRYFAEEHAHGKIVISLKEQGK